MFDTLYIGMKNRAKHSYIYYMVTELAAGLCEYVSHLQERTKTKTETKRRAKKPPIIQHVY